MKKRRLEEMRVKGFALLAAFLFVSGAASCARAQGLAAASAPAAAAVPTDGAWLDDLARWRAQREQAIDAPGGWLTLVGMEWLKPGANTVGGAADNLIQLHAHAPDHLGALAVSDNSVAFEAPAGGFPADLEVDGKPAQAGPLTVAGAKPATIVWRSLSMVVVNRGGRYALQIKDSDSPSRAAFHGLNWYAPNQHFLVQAKWTPYLPPHMEKIPTVMGTTLDLPSPGVAEFTIYGMPLRLEPVIEDSTGRTLFFILRDQTRYDTTYDAARYLHTGLPDHGLDKPGMLTLDFNRLENPPCAYTTFAACPLPPLGNRLLIEIKAGEKRYKQ
jgi:uncharacterized protein (DUF1684 family)